MLMSSHDKHAVDQYIDKFEPQTPTQHNDNDKLLSVEKESRNASMDQLRPLTPSKQLFYDPNYDPESDPEYQRKMHARKASQEAILSQVSAAESQRSFEKNLVVDSRDLYYSGSELGTIDLMKKQESNKNNLV